VWAFLLKKRRKSMSYSKMDSSGVSLDYLQLLPQILDHTLISSDRLYMLWQLAQNKKGGIGAEFGVYKGGSAKVIYNALEGELHLFDSFEGLPRETEHDLHKEGDFNDVLLKDVKEYLSDCPNIFYHVGWFSDIGKPNVIRYDFVHIDADLYESTMQALEYFYPRMKSGGFMIFDDYYWEGTPGVLKALHEFFSDKLETCINLRNAQCLIIKR
jgi:predicted O-methyltransferase YrrM